MATAAAPSLPDAPAELRQAPAAALLWLVREHGPAFAKRDESRSAKAFRIACAVKQGGGTYEELEATLAADAETVGWLREKGLANGGRELKRAWERAGGRATTEAATEEVLLTEHGVALAFRRRHEDRLRYCHDTGAWFVWTGTHWRQDRKHAAFSYARDLVAEANRGAEFRTQAITGKAAFAGGVERFARADQAPAVTADAWNPDPWLLGTPGGTVDLRTGELRPARPEDMIARTTAVAPADGGRPEAWLAFLREATAGDAALVALLQKWCGYCLTGDTREHALLFIYGPGGNGKSVFLNTVAGILGDYHATAAMDTFTGDGGGRHLAFLAMLAGSRMVTAAETEEGRPWAETKIKEMTGGTPVTANFMRQNPFTFTPRFKITVTGNHKPVLRNVDDAARRRFNIVPFLHRPAQPDRTLEERLRKEWPGILRWMIDGCTEWQQFGLMRPKMVAEATAEYFEAQDALGQWMAYPSGGGRAAVPAGWPDQRPASAMICSSSSTPGVRPAGAAVPAGWPDQRPASAMICSSSSAPARVNASVASSAGP